MMHLPESQLALYAGGELDSSELAAAAAHLESCEACRNKFEEFQAATKWLKALADEPGPEELAALRKRLPVRFAKRARAWWLAGAAAATAVVALLAVALGSFVRPAPKVRPPAATAQEKPPELSPRPTLPIRTHMAAARRTRPHRNPPQMTLVARNEGPPVIRLKTADPNVVVLWIVSGGSEQENQNE